MHYKNYECKQLRHLVWLLQSASSSDIKFKPISKCQITAKTSDILKIIADKDAWVDIE